MQGSTVDTTIVVAATVVGVTGVGVIVDGGAATGVVWVTVVGGTVDGRAIAVVVCMQSTAHKINYELVSYFFH